MGVIKVVSLNLSSSSWAGVKPKGFKGGKEFEKALKQYEDAVGKLDKQHDDTIPGLKKGIAQMEAVQKALQAVETTGASLAKELAREKDEEIQSAAGSVKVIAQAATKALAKLG